MWAEAATTLETFPTAVVTATGTDGYPVSIRVPSARYDASTGTLPVAWPPNLDPAAGPAIVLGHYHDENLWNIRMMQIKGRLEQRDEGWVFVSTAFTPPAPMLKAFLQMARSSRAVAARYLAKRGLPKPTINWAALEQLRRRARRERL
jgi:hypothetical protein